MQVTVQRTGIVDEVLLCGRLDSRSAADVRDVMVGGRFIVRAGSHLALDVAAELDKAVGRLPA